MVCVDVGPLGAGPFEPDHRFRLQQVGQRRRDVADLVVGGLPSQPSSFSSRGRRSGRLERRVVQQLGLDRPGVRQPDEPVDGQLVGRGQGAQRVDAWLARRRPATAAATASCGRRPPARRTRPCSSRCGGSPRTGARATQEVVPCEDPSVVAYTQQKCGNTAQPYAAFAVQQKRAAGACRMAHGRRRRGDLGRLPRAAARARSSARPSLLVVILGVLAAWYGSLQHEVIHGHPTPWGRVNVALAAAPLDARRAVLHVPRPPPRAPPHAGAHRSRPRPRELLRQRRRLGAAGDPYAAPGSRCCARSPVAWCSDPLVAAARTWIGLVQDARTTRGAWRLAAHVTAVAAVLAVVIVARSAAAASTSPGWRGSAGR